MAAHVVAAAVRAHVRVVAGHLPVAAEPLPLHLLSLQLGAFSGWTNVDIQIIFNEQYHNIFGGVWRFQEK